MKKDMKPIIVIGLVIIAVIAIAFMVMTPHKEVPTFMDFIQMCEETGGTIIPGPPCGVGCYEEKTECDCPLGIDVTYGDITYSMISVVVPPWDGCLQLGD